MRIYTIHLRRHGLDPEKDVVVLKDGFSWPAFLFGAPWALWHRMWWAALALIVGAAVTSGLGTLVFSDPLSPTVLASALALLAGLLGHDLRVWTLERQGFVLSAVVSADGSDHALQRYLDDNAELAYEINRIEGRA